MSGRDEDEILVRVGGVLVPQKLKTLQRAAQRVDVGDDEIRGDANGFAARRRRDGGSANRAGDGRHCYADISKISRELGYIPRVNFRQGVAELVEWIRSQQAHDYTEQALLQLTTRGLVA